MNRAFKTILAASEAERRDLFLTAATRLGTTVQNTEKDFWVCWTLDALFNGLPESGPRLLFHGVRIRLDWFSEAPRPRMVGAGKWRTKPQPALW